MPVEAFEFGEGNVRTSLVVSSDPVGLPSDSAFGSAFDLQDTDTQWMTDVPAPVAPDPLGVVWHATPTTYVGRILLQGDLDVDQFITKYDGQWPSSVTIHVKMRRQPVAHGVIPAPEFIFWGGGSQLTWEDAAYLTPTRDWEIWSRELTAIELNSLTKEGPNSFKLIFRGNWSTSAPLEAVDVAWFAVSYGIPSE